MSATAPPVVIVFRSYADAPRWNGATERLQAGGGATVSKLEGTYVTKTPVVVETHVPVGA